MTQTHALDVDGVWRAIDAARSSLADLLADLSADEWRRPSLCPEWTVRDVAAHLTMQQAHVRESLGTLLRWRGTIDRTIAYEATRRAAALTTEQLVMEIRGMVGSRHQRVGVTYKSMLIDNLVHGQDIAVPLGRTLPIRPETAAFAASRTLSMRWPPPLSSVRTVSRFRLVATDISWSAGDGPEVRGPMAALLLVCCGRVAALPQLTGDGVADLRRRLTA